MAVTKILSIGSCGRGYHGKHLSQALDYIMDKEKTDGGRWTGFLNCCPGDVYAQMQQTKELFGKTDKRQGYHIILSFAEGEADAAAAFEIVGKFAKEYLGNGYEALYTIHNNTDHIHGHLIFNSVNFQTGNKFHYKKGDWAKKIQPVTNQLCEEYGLSTVEIPEIGKGVSRERKDVQKQDIPKGEKVIWADRIKKDLDAVILQVSSYEAFLSVLAGMGYDIKNAYPQDGKYLAVKLADMARYQRCKSLGKEYTRKRIQERILQKNSFNCQIGKKEEPRIINCQIKQKKRTESFCIQNGSSARFYQAVLLKKYPGSQAEKYRKDILRMKELQEDYLFLCKYDIHTIKDVESAVGKITEEKRKLSREKSQVYKERAKKKPFFRIVEEMEDLQVCENCFQRGEDAFLEEHGRYQEFAGQLQKEGYTVAQLKQMEEDLKRKTSLVQQKEKEAAREERTAARIIEEWKNRKQEMEKQTGQPVAEKEKGRQENRGQRGSR